MAKRIFTDESLTTLVDQTKSYVDSAVSNKVDKVSGKGLSTNDLTNALKANYDAAYAHSNTTHVKTKSDIGLSNVDNTSDLNKPVSKATTAAIKLVEDKITTHTDNEDIHFTAAERTKLAGIASSANKYTHPNSGVSAGTYSKVVVNAAGHVTSGSNPTSISGYGITDAYTKTQVDTAISNAKTAANTYTDGKIDAIMGEGAAETLNTIGEISAAIEQDRNVMDALNSAIGNKVDKVSGKGLSTNDYTTTEKNKLAGIATGAEVNQNAFSNIVIGSTTVAADSKTDSVSFSGTNITIEGDATNDKITFTVPDGTTSAKGVVQLSNSTSSSSTTAAATPKAVKTAYDLASTAKTMAESAAANSITGLSVSGQTVTYTKGNGTTASITTQDTKYTHPSYTARTGVPTANATPGFGDTFTVSQPVSDTSGHITAINSRTITIPATSAGSSLGLVKTGGDVTISDGVITVNDDSHNHSNYSTTDHGHSDYVSKSETAVQCLAGGLVVGRTSADGLSGTGTGRIMFTGTTNPLIGVQSIAVDGTIKTPYYIQTVAGDNKLYIGPTSSKALVFDSDGNMSSPANLSITGTISEGGTALSDKYQEIITGGISNVVSENFNADRVIVSNSNGKVKSSGVTSTELGFLTGVTSNIQTQLDGKLSSSGTAVAATTASKAGTATYATNAGTATYATNAGTASYSSNGAKATSATSATYASTATKAGTATYATNSGTAAYSSNGAKATSATSATYATTATNAGTATYAKTASTATYLNATSAISKYYRVKDANGKLGGQFYSNTAGTTATAGNTYLMIGNSTATGVAGNCRGYLRLYDATTCYTEFKTHGAQTANRTVAIPNASGTMALMSHFNRTNGVASANTSYTTYMARGVAAGTGAMTAKSTTMTNGVIYLQYA